MKESCDNSDDRWARVPLFPLLLQNEGFAHWQTPNPVLSPRWLLLRSTQRPSPKSKPALRSHTRPLYSMGRQWNAQFGFVSLSCQVRVVFFTQGYLFVWCHMFNLVLHCKSLRFTLHVRGEERCSHLRAPSSFICPSMIPSLLSGDGWQAAQSLPEMGSFHHAHMPQSRSPLSWRGCVNVFCLRMDVSSLPLQNVNGLFHRDYLEFVQGHAAVWPFVLPLCVVWQITLWWTTAPVSKPVPATRWRWRRTESRCASPALISAQKVITRNIKLTKMLIKVNQNVMLW